MNQPFSSRHLPALDGLRGVAILLVMLGHFTVLRPEGPAEAALLWTLRSGWVGVDLFFVLSGFLITGILLDTRDAPGYFRVFYARRALRIFPLYYGFLALYLTLVPRLFVERPAAVAALGEARPYFLTYATNFLLARTESLPFNTAHLWSLAVEEQFYLVWPFAVFLLSRRGLGRLCVALIGGSFVLRCALLLAGVNPTAIYMLTPTRMDALAVGALLALLVRARGVAWVSGRARAPLLGLGALSAAVFLLSPGWQTTFAPLQQTVGFTLFAGFFGCVLARTLTVSPGSLWGRITRGRVLRGFGRYSYGLYVVHYPLLTLLPSWRFGVSTLAGQAAYMLAMTLLSLLLALVSWHLWEKHWLRLKGRVPYRQPEPAPAPAPVAAAS